MLLKKSPDIPSSEITDECLYLRRREFIRLAGGAAMVAAAAPLFACSEEAAGAAGAAGPGDGTFGAPNLPLTGYKEKAVTVDEKLNTLEEISGIL